MGGCGGDGEGNPPGNTPPKPIRTCHPAPLNPATRTSTMRYNATVHYERTTSAPRGAA